MARTSRVTSGGRDGRRRLPDIFVLAATSTQGYESEFNVALLMKKLSLNFFI
jgi:hypothetical protein